ncbi:MAG: metal-dependent transcriptional regulator [Caldisphaera sp.]|nr:MAG: metal-dependent transcriptional regulator [Caldisphaera sp.]PMP89483.1 MAG: metal-dependent transcriptional regulator [Caldisphaera sp.]
MSVHIKRNNISISLEEYLTTIYKQGGETKWVKTGDIADFLGISPASVTEAVQKLAKEGYLQYFSYRGVMLTKKGADIASAIAKKENDMKQILIMIGINYREAEEISCLLEHKISDDALEKLKRFINDCISKNKNY